VLESLGVNLEKIRTQTIQVLSHSSASSSAGPGTTVSSAPVTTESGPRLRQVEYLTVSVGLKDGEAVVLRLDGEEAVGEGTPLHRALQVLGEGGWRLAGIHPLPAPAGDAHALYVFQRETRP
jgi:hypothetical protein